MSQVSKAILRGLLTPSEHMSWWDDQSGEFDAGGTKLFDLPSGGPVPGIPVPTAETEMVLQASGTQSARGSLDVMCQRGGYPDRDRASYLWRITGDPDWYGWDAPSVLTAWEPIDWTSTAATCNLHPHAVTLSDDTVVAVVQRGTTAFAPEITAYIRDPDDGGWTDMALYALAGQNQNAHPCLCLLPSGRLLCFFWVEDTVGAVANIRMMFSDDAGLSWATGQDACLETSVPVSTSTSIGSVNYSTGRLRAAYANGQILLMANLLSMDTDTGTHMWRDALWQYASVDLGATFTLVTATESLTGEVIGGNYQDIVVLDGRFVIAWLDASVNTPQVRVLANAFEPWTNITLANAAPDSEPWGLSSSDYYDDTDLCLFRDEAGNLYITGPMVTLDFIWSVYCSRDGGATWEPVAKSSSSSGAGKWSDFLDADTYPSDACATWQRGRALVIHRHASTPASYTESLSCSFLGGYSTVTMPPYELFKGITKMVAWGQTYLPFDLPDDVGWLTATSGGGPPSVSLSTGRLAFTGAGTGRRDYYVLPNGSLTNGLMATATVQSPTTATTTYGRFDVYAGDATNGWAVRVTITKTAVTVTDLVGGGTLGTTAIAAGHEVQLLVGIIEDAAVVYWRDYDTGANRVWTELYSGSGLTNDGGVLNNNMIRFSGGDTAASGDTVVFRMVAYVADENSATNYVGQNLIGQVNPDDILGRPFSSVGTYIHDGVILRAVDGPAFSSDQWLIEARYAYPPENLLPTVTPSPRQAWRSAPITDLDASTAYLHLAWRLDEDGDGGFLGADAQVGNDIWGLFLDGLNCAGVKVDVYYGAAWHTVTTTGVQQFAGTRKGNTIIPTTTSTFGGKWRLGEAAGCGLGFYSVGYTVTDWTGSIAHNTEGTTATNGVTTKTPTFWLEETSGASSAAPSVGVWPRRHFITIHASGLAAAIQGIRLRVPVSVGNAYPGNPAAGYYEIGTVAFGPLFVFGHDYSWQRNIAIEPNTQVTESRDGRRSSRVLGPARRTLDVGWADGVDVTNWRSTTSPDYVKGSINAAALPVAWVHDIPLRLQDLLRHLGGPDALVVYVPHIDYDTNTGSGGDTVSSWSNWCDGTIYGRITSPVRIEQVLGDDEVDEVYRVVGLTLEEEV